MTLKENIHWCSLITGTWLLSAASGVQKLWRGVLICKKLRAKKGGWGTHQWLRAFTGSLNGGGIQIKKKKH